jgi:hypothetical protein
MTTILLLKGVFSYNREVSLITPPDSGDPFLLGILVRVSPRPEFPHMDGDGHGLWEAAQRTQGS